MAMTISTGARARSRAVCAREQSGVKFPAQTFRFTSVENFAPSASNLLCCEFFSLVVVSVIFVSAKLPCTSEILHDNAEYRQRTSSE